MWYLGVLVVHIGDIALLANWQQTYSEVCDKNLLHYMDILDSEAQNRISIKIVKQQAASAKRNKSFYKMLII